MGESVGQAVPEGRPRSALRAMPLIAALLIAVAATFVSLFSPQLREAASVRQECYSATLKARHDATLERRVCIPRGYVAGSVEGLTLSNLSAMAFWPSMDGAARPSDEPRSCDPTIWCGRLHLLFGPTRSYPGIGFRFEAGKISDAITIPAKSAFGLEHLVSDPSRLNRGLRIKHAYFAGSGEDLVYGICDTQNETSYPPHPGCRFEFVRDGLLIGVSFSHELLAQWAAILDASGRLVTGFTR